jgi:ribosomal protein S18 acetylase RimI-like enzyme
VHVLDNPGWHALTGPHRAFAEGGPLAMRYDPAVAPFAAIPDEPSPAVWDAMRDLVGPGGIVVLFRSPVAPPDGWEELFSLGAVQMVATSVDGRPAPDANILGPVDVPDMVELVQTAQPGPFTDRTIELGTYVGLRHDEALVAMAGERMRLARHTEISAVCTHPSQRRRGLASSLVRHLVDHITSRGETPFLHVADENSAAVAVYSALGFTVRRTFAVVGLRAPS